MIERRRSGACPACAARRWPSSPASASTTTPSSSAATSTAPPTACSTRSPRALRLDDAERLHLFDLARPGAAARIAAVPGRDPPQRAARRSTRSPAAWRSCATAAGTTSPPTRSAAPSTRRSSTAGPARRTRSATSSSTTAPGRSSTTGPPWRTTQPGSFAPRRGATPTTRALTELIEEMLEAAPSSATIWAQHDVRLPAAGRHRFHHPRVGLLDLVFEAAALRADPGLTLLLATADPGSPTEAALDQL